MDFTLFAHPEPGHSYKVKLWLEVSRIPHHFYRVDLDLPRAQQLQALGFAWTRP